MAYWRRTPLASGTLSSTRTIALITQIVSVPVELPIRNANHAFVTFMTSLTVVFAVLFVILNVMLTLLIVQPITQLSEAADHISKGRLDADKTMEMFKNYRNPNSPRGPISIDPATRDIVQNEYLREVRKVGGQLANVELETVATALKDPWKELNKK